MKLRYTLSTLLIVALIVALASWLVGDQIKSYRQQREAIDELSAFMPMVVWKGWNVVELRISHRDDGSEEIEPDEVIYHFTNKHMRHVASLPKLEFLAIPGTHVNDAGLRRLRNHYHLQTLLLHDCRITDEGLKHLAHLKQLRKLALNRTWVTENGLAFLAQELPETHVYYGDADYLEDEIFERSQRENEYWRNVMGQQQGNGDQP